MTSNVGSDVATAPKIGFGSESGEEDIKHDIKENALKNLKTEIINRIDEIIVFNKLTEVDLKDIISMQIKALSLRIKDNYKVVISVDDSVTDLLLEEGDFEKFGAREIKRNFRRLVENKIAEYLVAKKLTSLFLFILLPKISSNNKAIKGISFFSPYDFCVSIKLFINPSV